MTERIAWGVDPDASPLAALSVPPPDVPVPVFLQRVRTLATALDVPVQPVRADRVVSWPHLVLAATHAGRAWTSGRARGRDRGIEFLLYLAGDRQIQRAVRDLGVAPGADTPVLLVALDPVPRARLQAAAAEAGWPDAPVWVAGAPRCDGPAVAPAARAWWARRLGVPADDAARVEEAVFAAMALLAVAKA